MTMDDDKSLIIGLCKERQKLDDTIKQKQEELEICEFERGKLRAKERVLSKEIKVLRDKKKNITCAAIADKFDVNPAYVWSICKLSVGEL